MEMNGGKKNGKVILLDREFHGIDIPIWSQRTFETPFIYDIIIT